MWHLILCARCRCTLLSTLYDSPKTKSDIYRHMFYIIFQTAGTIGIEYFSLIEILQDDIQHYQWKVKITCIYRVKDNKSTYKKKKKRGTNSKTNFYIYSSQVNPCFGKN
jgi:hypothetical protein